MRGLLFLFSALFLLESTKGTTRETNYNNLNEQEKGIVTEAIKLGNKDHLPGKHLDFYEVQRKENAVKVILRPTSCDKTTPSVHLEKCKTENKAPQVACIHCNGSMKEKCLLIVKEKEKVEKTWNECSKYFSGSSSLMLLKGGNGQPLTGCLGCI